MLVQSVTLRDRRQMLSVGILHDMQQHHSWRCCCPAFATGGLLAQDHLAPSTCSNASFCLGIVDESAMCTLSIPSPAAAILPRRAEPGLSCWQMVTLSAGGADDACEG
jgi:hypothetical protein